MSAQKTGSLSATGSVTLTKPDTDTVALVQISGTYGTVTFVIEGSIDGTNWFPIVAIRLDTGVPASSSLAPADNATLCWLVPGVEGLIGIRARVTAIASGTAAFAINSAAYVGSPLALLSQSASVGNTLLSGDLQYLGSAAAADGAITQKSGIVVITKAGVAAALTIGNPTATTDDFKTLLVIAGTALAHTLSNAAGAGFNAGGAGSDVGTFGGAKGDNILLMAYQGVWYVVSKVNVTLA